MDDRRIRISEIRSMLGWATGKFCLKPYMQVPLVCMAASSVNLEDSGQCMMITAPSSKIFSCDHAGPHEFWRLYTSTANLVLHIAGHSCLLYIARCDAGVPQLLWQPIELN